MPGPTGHVRNRRRGGHPQLFASEWPEAIAPEPPTALHFRKENEGFRHLGFFYLHGYFKVFQVTSIRTHKLKQNSSDQLYQVPLLCCPASWTCGCFEGGKHHIQLFRGAFAEMLRHRWWTPVKQHIPRCSSSHVVSGVATKTIHWYIGFKIWRLKRLKDLKCHNLFFFCNPVGFCRANVIIYR